MSAAARTLRFQRVSLQRTARQFRRNQSSHHQGSHTTYFQPPPEPPRPRRNLLRSALFTSTSILTGVVLNCWWNDQPLFGFQLPGTASTEAVLISPGEDFELNTEALGEILSAGTRDAAAREVIAMDLKHAQSMLEMRSGYATTHKTISHMCQLPSNLPCEDAWSSGTFPLLNDDQKNWSTWSIYDGHAGTRTAQVLSTLLPAAVGSRLFNSGCMSRPYIPDDFTTIQSIKNAFTALDNDILRTAADAVDEGRLPLPLRVCMLAPAFSGSCALMALFDPKNDVLRVACTGDSRAVLGTWDAEKGKYVAKAMSVDQTGFNPEEVTRLKEEHPDEQPVDARTGRVFGIAVSRAFGDARWKWTEKLTRMAHEQLWGPAPRPNNAIKTPPYLTAEPEVTETKVRTGAHPDFLIMASDGLWDHMSSEHGVECVERWLEKFQPKSLVERQEQTENEHKVPSFMQNFAAAFGVTSMAKPAASALPFDERIDSMPRDEDPEIYIDEKEGQKSWVVSPKHFVVEDVNVGVHLIKNALGGRRRELFCGLLSLQPPISRDARDDITVHVIFFGASGKSDGTMTPEMLSKKDAKGGQGKV